jgi:hypothetical protein
MKQSTVALISIVLMSIATAGVAELDDTSTWRDCLKPDFVFIMLLALATGLKGLNSRHRLDEQKEIDNNHKLQEEQ